MLRYRYVPKRSCAADEDAENNKETKNSIVLSVEASGDASNKHTPYDNGNAVAIVGKQVHKDVISKEGKTIFFSFF